MGFKRTLWTRRWQFDDVRWSGVSASRKQDMVWPAESVVRQGSILQLVTLKRQEEVPFSFASPGAEETLGFGKLSPLSSRGEFLAVLSLIDASMDMQIHGHNQTDTSA